MADNKFHSFQWNNSVYSLHKVDAYEYRWFNVFECTRYGSDLTPVSHRDIKSALLAWSELRKRFSSTVGEICVHDSFLEMFSYWANNKDVDIK